jgi:hypothetical protein
MNPGMSSTPTDLDGFRCLTALITSESETEVKGKITTTTTTTTTI